MPTQHLQGLVISLSQQHSDLFTPIKILKQKRIEPESTLEFSTHPPVVCPLSVGGWREEGD